MMYHYFQISGLLGWARLLLSRFTACLNWHVLLKLSCQWIPTIGRSRSLAREHWCWLRIKAQTAPNALPDDTDLIIQARLESMSTV